MQTTIQEQRGVGWLLVFAASYIVLTTAPLRAEHPWPQFRGPDGQGHTPAGTKLPLRWSDTENITWRTTIPGIGWSSPVIADDGKIWLTTASDEGHSLRVIRVDARSGELLWDHEVFHCPKPVTKNAKNSYASPSPVLAGDRLIVHYGSMGTACIDIRRNEVLWTNEELQCDHKEGPGSSPAVFEDRVIIPCDGMDVQYIAALDLRTGSLLWKTDRSGEMPENPDFRKAYSTPLIVERPEGPIAVIPGADQVVAYSVVDGSEVWKVRYKGFSNVPRPIADRDRIYVATGFMRPQFWAIRWGGKGDITGSHVEWKFTRQFSANPSPILVDNRIYFISDNGVAGCLAADSGEEIWTKRLGGNFSASPIHAAGYLYFASEAGVTYVLRADDGSSPGNEGLAAGEEAEGPNIVATNRLSGAILASPAVRDNALFLRVGDTLIRIDDHETNEVHR